MIKRSTLAIFALAASTTVPALAQSNLYAVVGVGRSTIDVDGAAVDAFAIRNGLTTSVTGTDSRSTGWKLQLGAPLNNTWAIEGGYMNLGTARFTNTNNAYTATGDKKADLFNLDIVGKFPLSQSFSLLGRFGVYRWETKSNVPTSAGMTNTTDNGFDWKFGAGGQYDFTTSFALRGSFDRFNGIGSQNNTGDSKANLLSVDAVLKF